MAWGSVRRRSLWGQGPLSPRVRRASQSALKRKRPNGAKNIGRSFFSCSLLSIRNKTSEICIGTVHACNNSGEIPNFPSTFAGEGQRVTLSRFSPKVSATEVPVYACHEGIGGSDIMNEMNSAVVNTSQDSDLDSRRFHRDILLLSLAAVVLWLALMIMIMAC